jgi:hypothetical protein
MNLKTKSHENNHQRKCVPADLSGIRYNYNHYRNNNRIMHNTLDHRKALLSLLS